MKKIVVFGANGRTGRHIVMQALENNFQVTAIVRDPATLEFKHANLRIVKGDILKPVSYTAALENADAVVSAIGPLKINKPIFIFSEGISRLIEVMSEKKVARIICISAAAVEISPKLSAFARFFAKYVLQKILRHLYRDLRNMEDILRKSQVQWTAVRPPRLTNRPVTGKYRFAANEYLDDCYSISRADLAHFIVHHINDPVTCRAIAEVAN